MACYLKSGARTKVSEGDDDWDRLFPRVNLVIKSASVLRYPETAEL